MKPKKTNMQKYETKRPKRKIKKDLGAIFGSFGLKKKLKIKLE
jgi:hypothetical protein